MNTKLLKQKILDLAIRGKLTQQLKSDGTARELLEQIYSKVSSSSSTLSSPRRRGSPSSSAAKTIVPLDKSEAPFEIPANWEWVRLGDLMSKVGAGSTPTGGRNIYESSGVKFIRSQNVYNEGLYLEDVVYINESIHKQKQNSKVVGNDLLLNITGASIGRCAIVPNDFDEANVNQHVLILRLLNFDLLKYIHLAITSQFVFHQIMGAQVGGTKEGLSAERAKELQIPLPPLAEQQRIVAKIEEAFAEIEAIEKNKELLKTHIKQTRQKILDLAIHGKLVPQNKSDEPASVLLERITRDNPHYEKMTDVPFEIPDSWEWVKLGNICTISSAKRVLKEDWKETGIPFYRAREIAQLANGEIVKDDLFITKELYESLKDLYGVPQTGDILMSAVGTIGKTYIVNKDDCFYYKDASVICLKKKHADISSKYLKMLFSSNYLQKQMFANSNGTTVDTITISVAQGYTIPFPPLAEQKRIVDKIEEIFKSLDEISLHLV